MSDNVSVYIPTHNRPKLLARALESLKKQSYDRIQVLICDDGSSVSYESVYEEYKKEFSDMQILKNEKPMGACYSRNALINIADGTYITGLDDDDEFLPSRIADFVNAPQLNRYSYLCAGHFTKTKLGLYKQLEAERIINLKSLLNRNIVGNQIFTKTEMLRGIGGFDEKFPAWQDYDVWVRMTCAYGDGFKLSKSNYQWNIDHEEGRISNSQKAKIGYEMFIEKHKSILNKKNLASLFFQDKINRNQQISFKDLVDNYSNECLSIFLKYKINKKYPLLKRIIYNAK